MFKYKSFLFFLLFTPSLFAQKTDSLKKPNRFSFEYAVGYQKQNMYDLNRFYIDSFASKSGIFNKQLHHGIYRNFSFFYHPSSYWSIGLNYKTDQASIQNQSEIYVTDQSGNIIDTIQSNYSLSSKNMGLGLQLQMHWIALIYQFNQSELWKNLHMTTSLGLSYNSSIVNLSSKINDFNLNDSKQELSQCFGSSLQLKISYPILRMKFSQLRLGLNLGYQWIKSDTALSNTGDPWLVLGAYPIKTSYSGLNCGLGLTYEIGNRKHIPLKQGASANSIFIDLFGQALYGTLGYDRVLNIKSTKINHSISAGILYLSQFPWSYLRVASIPLSYNLLLDFNKNKNLPHKLELGIGISGLHLINEEDNYKSKESYIYPSLRMGYRYHSMSNGLFYRVTFTPALPGLEFSNGYGYFGSAAFFGQRFMPWTGVSIGKTF
jgi:hypothetical protein